MAIENPDGIHLLNRAQKEVEKSITSYNKQSKSEDFNDRMFEFTNTMGREFENFNSVQTKFFKEIKELREAFKEVKGKTRSEEYKQELSQLKKEFTVAMAEALEKDNKAQYDKNHIVDNNQFELCETAKAILDAKNAEKDLAWEAYLAFGDKFEENKEYLVNLEALQKKNNKAIEKAQKEDEEARKYEYEYYASFETNLEKVKKEFNDDLEKLQENLEEKLGEEYIFSPEYRKELGALAKKYRGNVFEAKHEDEIKEKGLDEESHLKNSHFQNTRAETDKVAQEYNEELYELQKEAYEKFGDEWESNEEYIAALYDLNREYTESMKEAKQKDREKDSPIMSSILETLKDGFDSNKNSFQGMLGGFNMILGPLQDFFGNGFMGKIAEGFKAKYKAKKRPTETDVLKIGKEGTGFVYLGWQNKELLNGIQTIGDRIEHNNSNNNIEDKTIEVVKAIEDFSSNVQRLMIEDNESEFLSPTEIKNINQANAFTSEVVNNKPKIEVENSSNSLMGGSFLNKKTTDIWNKVAKRIPKATDLQKLGGLGGIGLYLGQVFKEVMDPIAENTELSAKEQVKENRNSKIDRIARFFTGNKKNPNGKGMFGMSAGLTGFKAISKRVSKHGMLSLFTKFMPKSWTKGIINLGKGSFKAGSKIIGRIFGFVTFAIEGIIDGIKGMFRKDWGGNKLTRFISGFLAGSDGGIKNMFEQMGKWAGLGAVVGSVVPGLGTLIGGAIGLVLGGILGIIGGNRITKAFSAVGKWFSETVGPFFKDLGIKIWEGVKAIGNAVYEFFKPGLQFFASIGESAYEHFIKPFYEGVLAPIGNFFKTIAVSIKNVFVNCWKSIVETFSEIKAIFKETGTSFPRKIGKVIGTLGKGIIKFIKTLFVSIKDGIINIGKAFADIFINIKNWALGIWDNVKGFGTDVIDAIKNLFGGVKDNATSILDKTKEFFVSVGEHIASFGRKVAEIAVDVWNGIKKFFVEDIPWFFKELFAGVKEGFGDTGEKIGTFFEEKVKTPLINLFDKIKDGVNNVWDSIKNFAKDYIVVPLTNVFTKVKDGINDAIKGAMSGIKNGFSAISDFFEWIGYCFEGGFTNIWERVKEGPSKYHEEQQTKRFAEEEKIKREEELKLKEERFSSVYGITPMEYSRKYGEIEYQTALNKIKIDDGFIKGTGESQYLVRGNQVIELNPHDNLIATTNPIPNVGSFEKGELTVLTKEELKNISNSSNGSNNENVKVPENYVLDVDGYKRAQTNVGAYLGTMVTHKVNDGLFGVKGLSGALNGKYNNKKLNKQIEELTGIKNFKLKGSFNKNGFDTGVQGEVFGQKVNIGGGWNKNKGWNARAKDTHKDSITGTTTGEYTVSQKDGQKAKIKNSQSHKLSNVTGIEALDNYTVKGTNGLTYTDRNGWQAQTNNKVIMKGEDFGVEGLSVNGNLGYKQNYQLSDLSKRDQARYQTLITKETLTRKEERELKQLESKLSTEAGKRVAREEKKALREQKKLEKTARKETIKDPIAMRNQDYKSIVSPVVEDSSSFMSKEKVNNIGVNSPKELESKAENTIKANNNISEKNKVAEALEKSRNETKQVNYTPALNEIVALLGQILKAEQSTSDNPFVATRSTRDDLMSILNGGSIA